MMHMHWFENIMMLVILCSIFNFFGLCLFIACLQTHNLFKWEANNLHQEFSFLLQSEGGIYCEWYIFEGSHSHLLEKELLLLEYKTLKGLMGLMAPSAPRRGKLGLEFGASASS